MSDRQPRDFYIGDEARGFKDFRIEGPVITARPIRGKMWALIEHDGSWIGCETQNLVHASDGAPLGKFKGIRMRGHVMFYDDSEHGITDAVSLGEVNRLLGAEVE